MLRLTVGVFGLEGQSIARFVKPEEIAGMSAFLASSDAARVTDQVIAVEATARPSTSAAD